MLHLKNENIKLITIKQFIFRSHIKIGWLFIIILFIALLFITFVHNKVNHAYASEQPFRAATARIEITPSSIGFPNYFRAGYGTDSPYQVTNGTSLTATGLLLIDFNGNK